MTENAPARPWPALLPAIALLLVASAPASAHTSLNPGGSSFEEPDVSALTCDTGTSATCPRGEVLRISGEGLAATRSVTFLGGPGARDDRSARPQQRSPHRVLVAVPGSARSGPVKVRTTTATTTGPRLRVLAADAQPASPASAADPAAPAAAADGGVFPIRGKHEYGTEVNRFGGGRGHQGQDLFAACGTPLVAALAGTVLITKFQHRAGNYVVIDADDGTSQAYMHLAGPATVAKGQRVTAGQRIGDVGQTGRADGCHLHFEIWTGGWQTGGAPIDPLPALQRWDAAATT